MQLIMSLGDINDDSSIDNACIVYDKVNGSSGSRNKRSGALVRNCGSNLNEIIEFYDMV